MVIKISDRYLRCVPDKLRKAQLGTQTRDETVICTMALRLNSGVS